MLYKWEKEASEKFGKEITRNLIAMQKRYEKMKGENNCTECGTGNHGSLIVGKNGIPYILHFASCGIYCFTCGKKQR